MSWGRPKIPKYASKYKPYYEGKFSDDNFPDGYKHSIVRTTSEIAPILQQFTTMRDKVISLDFETTTLDIENRGDIVGCSFSFTGKEAYYVPFAHKVGDNADPDLEKFIAAAVKKADVCLVYNAEFEYRCLRRWGYDITDLKLFDIMGLIWNLDTNVNQIDLKSREKVILGWDRPDIEETFGKGKDPSMFTPEDTMFYACFDAISPFLFYKLFYKFVQRNKAILDIDMSVIQPVMEMEDFSFRADVDRLKQYEDKVRSRIQEAQKDIHEAVGYVFTIDSPKQLSDALEKAGVDTGERTKTGQMRTGEDFLDKVKDKFPIVEKIVKYKKDQKLISSYIRSLLSEADRTDNSLHFKYFVFRVPSGRLAAGGDKKNPYFAGLNIQNIPKPKDMVYRAVQGNGPESIMGWEFEPATPQDKFVVEGKKQEENIRSCFMLPEDYLWVSCDFCLAPDTQVETIHGPVPASSIFEMFKHGKHPMVKTPLGNKRITRALRTYPFSQYELVLANQVEIVCSGNHRWAIYEEGKIRWEKTENIKNGSMMVTPGAMEKLAGFVQTEKTVPVDVRLSVESDLMAIQMIGKLAFEDCEEQMFDFEVEGAHCFYADGVLSHNSGQELRLPAIFSGEPLLVNTFKNDGDPHQVVADRNEITRDEGKTLNFGVLYGANEYTLYRNFGIPLARGKILIANWWRSMPKLDRWAKESRRESRRSGYSATYFGRRRPLLFWYKQGSKSQIAFADRSAINHKVQGTGGDVMRIDLIKLHKEFTRKGQPGFYMLSSIHDEINMAVRKDLGHELIPALVDTMEFQLPSWPIKLTVGIELGWTWGDCYKFKLDDGKLVPDFVEQ